MSKYQIARYIRQEIRHLNAVIDRKIVRGLSYRDEARRHKLLLLQLKQLTGHSEGFFAKPLRFVSMFML